jgi:hypothetical protein
VSYSHASVSKLLSCVWKPYSACRNQSYSCWNHTLACCNYNRACRNHTRECHKNTHTCQNHTLRVETLLCVLKSQSWVSLSHSCVSKSEYVWKLHSACINHTRECHIKSHTYQNYFRLRRNHTLREKSHSTCGNCTLRVGINRVRVEITLVRVEITLVRVVITFVRVEILLVSVIITLYVLKSHFACRKHSCAEWNHSRDCRYDIRACQNHMLVEITLVRVVITLVSVTFTRIRVKTTLMSQFFCDVTENLVVKSSKNYYKLCI